MESDDYYIGLWKIIFVLKSYVYVYVFLRVFMLRGSVIVSKSIMVDVQQFSLSMSWANIQYIHLANG